MDKQENIHCSSDLSVCIEILVYCKTETLIHGQQSMHEVLVEVQILQDFIENLAFKKYISFVLGVILSCFVYVMTINYIGIPFANVSMCKQCPQVKN